MTEPVRLRDTNGAARALLSAGKLEVPRGARQRALAFTGVAASVVTTGTAAAAGATSLFKSVVLCVCLGTVGGGVASLAVSETLSRLSATGADPKPAIAAKAEPKPPGAAKPFAPTAAPLVPAPPAEQDSAPEPKPSDARANAPVSGGVPLTSTTPGGVGKPPRASSLFDEQRIIESARAAVSRGDATGALTTLDRYRQSYPQGQFFPEALALRIEALSARGDLTRARSLAAEFERRYPHHPMLAPVQAAVQGASNVRR
ncbi:MAG: outer membrane protein assembly factor BamD [Myxococcales bacterium]